MSLQVIRQWSQYFVTLAPQQELHATAIKSHFEVGVAKESSLKVAMHLGQTFQANNKALAISSKVRLLSALR